MENNQVRVRVRTPKSSAEASRYSLENCALEAKMMKESAPSSKQRDGAGAKESVSSARATQGLVDRDELKSQHPNSLQGEGTDDDDPSDSDESAGGFGFANPFSALS